ncbi:MAG: YqgE/AlgH family protein [Georgfuchsia sp.]
MDTVSLANHFLIAMPAMADPNFSRSLTYICEHNAEGALGVIINRPTEMTLGMLLERVDIAYDDKMPATEAPIYFGGPVQTDRGFVLHRPALHWQSQLRVNDDIALTSSSDVLQSIGQTGEPSKALVMLGYSGWAAGQLEWELSQNAWLTVQADPRVIFDLSPEARLDAALHLLGIDFSNLSEVAGHA